MTLGNLISALATLSIVNSVSVIALYRRIHAMSVTAAQAQQDLDALTQLVNTTIPAAIKLINDLKAANASGTQLDPVKVEQDVSAISTQLAELSSVLTGAPSPSGTSTPPTP